MEDSTDMKILVTKEMPGITLLNTLRVILFENKIRML